MFLAAFALLLICLLGGPLFLPGVMLGNFGDVYAYHHPLRHAAAASLQEGRLPLWNPYIFCGIPFAANPQAALYMPLSCLFYLFPALGAFDAGSALYLMLAFLGAQLLGRRWGLPPSGAFALAAAFALHPFVLYRIPQGIPTHLAALAFIPWTWLAIEEQGRGVRGEGRGTGLLWTASFLALVLSLQLLSGHPQFMAINLAGMAGYLLMRRPRALAPWGAGLALAAAVTAAQWVPTLEFLSRSVRAHWTPLYATAYSLTPAFFWTFVAPGRLGTPLEPGFTGLPSEFFEMAGLYPGLIPLALALWGLAPGRRSAALWALGAAGVFLALGAYNPVMRVWLGHPGFGSLRVPARWILLTLWALWMAACIGLRRLTDGLRAKGSGLRVTPALVYGVLAVAVLADLGSWGSKFLYAQDPAPFLSANREVLAALRASPQRYATAPEIPNPNKGMLYRLPNVTGYEAFYLAGAALHASRTQRRPSADGSHTTIEDFDAPGFKDVSLRYYLADLSDRNQESTPSTPLRVVVSASRTTSIENRRPLLVSGGAALYEVPDAQPMAYHEGAPYPDPDAPEIVEMRPERWKLVVPSTQDPAPGTRRLIIAQAYYPGWRAWIDGQPAEIEEHEGFLQKIRLRTHGFGSSHHDSGLRTVVVRFDPPLWAAALWTTVLATAAWAAAAAMGARRA